MVSVLDLEQYHLCHQRQVIPYSEQPVILMLFLSKRCQFLYGITSKGNNRRPSQDDQTHHSDGLDDLVSVLVEPNGIEPLTS